MTLTILFDLDDTLLLGSTYKFIPAYISNFGAHLSKISGEPKQIVSQLMASTEIMVANNDPSKTLKQVFDASFYPELNWDYQTLQAPIEEFYQTIYPTFKDETSPNPAGSDTVNHFLKRGDQIVIATNPIFPEIAVNQRIEWANLAAERESFALVSTYETFHFAKPNPAYYTEILGRIGWPEHPMVMVGDNKSWDIDSPQELGIPTYWIDGENDYTQKGALAPYGSGKLEGLLPWLESLPTEQLIPNFNSPTASIAIQRSTPAVLSALIGNIDPAEWHTIPADHGWDLTEIICHLRDVDQDIYLPRIKQVLDNERPFIEAIDADSWAEERKYKQQDGSQALSEFISARLELLALIDNFGPAHWEKEIKHTLFGPLSLAELIRISARHDKLHIQHIFENLIPQIRN
jgi:FMN phosphatase YigB (HAD superfamily)